MAEMNTDSNLIERCPSSVIDINVEAGSQKLKMKANSEFGAKILFAMCLCACVCITVCAYLWTGMKQ